MGGGESPTEPRRDRPGCGPDPRPIARGFARTCQWVNVGMRRIADIGAAVIGTGFIGTVHVEALRRIGVQVRGVLGSTPERGAARAEALGVPRAYRRSRTSCDDPAVDAVHVTSPNDLHLPQAKAVLAAGRHVICEKPLAMSAAESRELVELAAAERARQRRQLQHPLLPAQPARPRRRHRRRDRRRPAGHRALLPGLAAARERLELAAPAGARRGPAGGRRHRLALARPDDLHDRPARRLGDGRAGHLHRGTPRADRPGRDVLDRCRRRDRHPRHRDRGRGDDPAALRERRTRRGQHQPDQRRAEELAPVRDRRVRSPRSPGTRSSPTRSGSAIASGRTRSSSRTRPSWAPAGRAAAALPGGHVEGFGDTFAAHFRAVYADVAAGGPSARADLSDVRRRPRRDAGQRRDRRERPARSLGRRRPRPASPRRRASRRRVR